jgi:uncharacterized membrane protein
VDVKTFFWSILLSLVPISELRGGIPYGYFLGIKWYVITPVCVAANALVPFLAWWFLEGVNATLCKIPVYRRWFDRFLVKAQMKVAPKIKKYGYLGLMLFVAVPLPVTGAWTGTVAAWVLGLDKRKAQKYIMLGVCIAGAIVIAICTGGKGVGSVFIKHT